MKLKTKEELPFKYFVVKRDNSQDWKDYIKWLSKGYIDFWTGNHYDYYGFDGGKYQCGINAFDKIEYFINNPKLFTAREFMDILRGNESMLLEPNTYAKFQSSYRVKALFNKAKDNRVKTFSEFRDSELFLMVGDGGILYSAMAHSPNKKEISPEEFEERLNNTIKAMKKEDKEIIGYKAPQDFYNGLVKKGDIVKYGSVEASYASNGRSFPKEIVEQWEPVYKVEYKVGDWVTVDVKLVEKDKPNHILVLENKYKLTQKLLSNIIPDWYGNDFDWSGDCYLNSKWFRLATPEEIASVEEEVVGMGGFDVVVTPNGIFHKHDNITDFCKGLYDYNANLPKELGGYGLKFGDISFIRTGCQDNLTKLDAWVGVYSKYLEKQKL